MKKTFMILGGVFAVLIILAVIGIAVVAVKGTALDKESKAYVDRVVPVVCADLRFETLSQYASKNNTTWRPGPSSTRRKSGRGSRPETGTR
ncbi:MAG: hypothetical protein JRJ15_06285 [Deltaproteobacteria bacterium]|nr:hypothetical protein [Deltaproteobacteria bacterium]